MEMQFAFDEDEAVSMTPLVAVTQPGNAAILKRQISDDERSRSPTCGVESDKLCSDSNFTDLTFKDVPDGIEAPQQSAAISIPNASNGPITDVTTANGVRRRKKRRPVDLGRPLRFEELYEPTGERLGAGAYATVATYRDCRTQREYAVKCIEKHSYSIRTRVFKEIEIFNACAGHPHVVQLIEFYETDKEFYLVFEKMNGGTLLHAIQERGHFSEAEARDVVLQIAEALCMLHKRGIAHRDLKPENILCEHAGQLRPVKIGDFDLGSDVPLPRRSHSSSTSTTSSIANRATAGSGVAIMEDDEDSISTPPLLTPVGSLEYMAPEVVDTWMGEANMYDKKCDVWSIGVILYILLSGKPPFYGQCGQQCGWEEGGSCYTCQTMLCERIQRGEYEFPERDWRAVSPEAVDLVRKMLVRDPHRRASAEEVLQHPWFSLPLRAARPLETPRILSRKTSLAGLATYAENANAWNRLIAQQHSGNVTAAHYTVSCYLPSPRFDDQLTELLEVDDSAQAKVRNGVGINADGYESNTDSIVPILDYDLKEGARTGTRALSVETGREEIQPSSATGVVGTGSGVDRVRYTTVRPRVRLPSVGTGANLAHAARRLRFLSRSIDSAATIGVSPSSNRGARDGSPRFQPAKTAGTACQGTAQVRE